MGFDQTFPAVLAELNAIEFDYAGGDGIDFEPYQEFQSAEDNASWIQAWTGNPELTGGEYRVFGQDGTGGYAAFWLIRPDAALLDQPIVFFGSEGELGMVAPRFTDYLWLLAGGVGPCEAALFGTDDEHRPQPELAAFAERHGGAPRLPAEVLAAARSEFPDFEATFRALCR